MVQVKSAFSKAYSVLTDAKLITSLGPNRSILGAIVRPDSVLLDRKGWNTDGALADMLAEPWEPVTQRFDSENDAMYNWHALDDDEPLPRNTQPASEDTSSSPLKKRKSKSNKKSRKKAKADASSSDDTEDGSRNRREHSKGKGSTQSERKHHSAGSSRQRKGPREYDRFTNTLPQYTHISRW
jgi:non-canonical poly(A) RNA polymerase PAPD5/7